MRCFIPLFMLVLACGDDGKRPLGADCDSNSECESRLCLDARCVDPDADDDLDGLTNGIEAGLTSNAEVADSDGDGVDDGDEVGAVVSPTDSDGDGKPDVIESAITDADGDCVPDQDDPADDDADVPGDACAVGACDGILTDDEACDDGNLVPTDGCDRCVIVPTLVSTTGTGYQPTSAALEGGGILMSFDESGPLGRSVVAFDADGIEVARTSGDNTGDQRNFVKAAIGLRGGNAALATWRYDAELREASLEVQRYDAKLDKLGPLVVPFRDTNYAAYLSLVPTTTGAYAAVTTDSTRAPRYVVHFVDANDRPGAVIEQPLRELQRVAAAGLEDGTVVVASLEAGEQGLDIVVRRFEPGGKVTDTFSAHSARNISAFSVAPVTKTLFGVFFAESTEASISVGYRVFDGAAPASDVRWLATDEPGCADELSTTFEGESPIVVAIDSRCGGNVLRGWYGEGTRFTLGVEGVPLYAATVSSNGTPVFSWGDGSETSGGAYLQRGIGKDITLITVRDD